MIHVVLLYCVATSCCATLITFFVTRKFSYTKMLVCIEQNNAKIKALETEIDKLLHNKHAKMQEEEANFNKQLLERKNELENKHNDLVKKLETTLRQKEEDAKTINYTKQDLIKQKEEQAKILMQYEISRNRLLELLEEYTSLTKEEGRNILLEYLKDDLIQYKANLIRRYETEAKAEAKRRANYIIAQATTRFAGDFVNDRLINIVSLPNDEMKGKIIGKEGRNIKTFEMVCGVNVIIEDTPNEIMLSSFNIYRRALATRTLELLVEDGRIHPSRIEEVYEKVKEQMEEQLYQEGDEVTIKLNVGYVEPALKKLIGKLKYRASFGQNALEHSLEVARLAGSIASELGGDEKLARRAGLLHDIGKALTDELGGNHVDRGVEICSRYNEHSVVINAILAHHGNEESKSIECSAVCTADVLSAARPGARKEVLENYISRVQDLENIAMEKFGVKQAYAVYAGREVRVIVRADLVNDSQSIVLAREIASDIKQQIQYPGDIKVNVIRETRAIEYA